MYFKTHTTVSDAPLWDSGPLAAPSGGGGGYEGGESDTVVVNP